MMKHIALDTRQLEAFAAVISIGSVTGAARTLGRSQSVVTRQIQDLEATLGFSLFDRNGPRISPSERAMRFHAEVERYLTGMAMMGERIDAIREGSPPAIDIAATPALASSLVPRALARLGQAALPRQIHLHSGSAEEVVRQIVGRTADLGVTSLPLDHPGMEIDWMGEAPCAAVLREDDPLAAKPVVALKDLAGRRIIAMANPYRLQSRIVAALAANGVEPGATINANTSQAGVALVREGLGIAITEPVTAFSDLPEGVTARPLDVAIDYLFGVVVPAGEPRSDVTRMLSEALRSVAEEQLPAISFKAGRREGPAG